MTSREQPPGTPPAGHEEPEHSLPRNDAQGLAPAETEDTSAGKSAPATPGASRSVPGEQPGNPAGVPSATAGPASGQRDVLSPILLGLVDDPARKRVALLVAAWLLLISVFLPVMTGPRVLFVWDSPDRFNDLLWPLIVAAIFFRTAARLHRDGKKASWFVHVLPVAVGLASIVMLDRFFFLVGTSLATWFATVGYPLLLLGLVLSLDDLDALFARILWAAGCCLLVIALILDGIGPEFPDQTLLRTHKILQSLVFLVGVGSSLLLPRWLLPRWLLPRWRISRRWQWLRPWIAGGLLLWMVVQTVFVLLIYWRHVSIGANALWTAVHFLIEVIVYFGVLLTAPDAYGSIKERWRRRRSGREDRAQRPAAADDEGWPDPVPASESPG